MFTSDNGVMWAEHGLADKGFPYLGDLRVPVLLRWPGHVTPGTSDPRLAANIDIAPTILDAVGLAPTPARPMDGRSLLAPEGPRTLLGEWWVTPKRRFYAPTWSALLTSRFEFVEYRTVRHVIAREYYDLVRDPWELRNLLNDGIRGNGPDVQALHVRLRALRSCAGASCA